MGVLGFPVGLDLCFAVFFGSLVSNGISGRAFESLWWDFFHGMFLLVFLISILISKYIGISYVKDSFLKNEAILLLSSIINQMVFKMLILK